MGFYKLKESPEVEASFVSKLFYWWLNPLFRLGYTRGLEIEDLHRVHPEDEAKKLGEALEQGWTEEQLRYQKLSRNHIKLNLRTQPKLLNVILRVFGGRFVLVGLIKFFEECVVKMAQPVCLALLIRYFFGDLDRDTGLLAGIAIILGSCLNVMTMHPYFHGVERIGMQIRVACSSLLYRKALRLSYNSLEKTTVGKLLNMLTNERFDNIQNIHYIWIGLIQASITTYILWGYFGPYCLCGLSVLFLFVPFQGSMGRILSKLRLQAANRTDGRLRIINEILNGIRVIKMYAWEAPFSKLVNEARRSEMKVLRKITTFRAINWSLSFTSTQVTIFITLLVYVLDGNVLTSEKVFVCLALYSCIRTTLGLHFPLGIYELGEFWVSAKRVQEFLMLEELNQSRAISNNINPTLKKSSISEVIVHNLSAKWSENDTQMVLSGVSFHVLSSQLFAIVGPVGSGKSSLLLILLRELPPCNGGINVCGEFAYVPQESWIFAGNIRENILFGKDFNPEWYEKVIDACALHHDLSLLSNGDLTIVGDRGITLSGGQKARVSLARAVYANADIYLLDDPLSAVDTEVAKHVFENCIRRVLKDKIVILITHQVQFLNAADEILCLERGRISAQGSPLELKSKGFDFSQVLQDKTSDSNLNLGKKSITNVKNDSTEAFQIQGVSGMEVASTASDDKLSEVVNFRIYREYFRAGSTFFSFSALVFFNIGTQFAQSGSEYWLQFWTKSMESKPSEQTNYPITISEVSENKLVHLIKTDLSTQVGIYTGIILTMFLFSLIRTSMFFQICLNAGKNLHNKMFYNVVRTTMQFFEVNSSGRILNRFSKDTDLMDDALPPTFFVSIEVILRGLGSVVLIAIITPYILLPAAVLTVFLLIVRRIYVRTARSIKRLEANARSPLLSHFSSSLYGIRTIRAFRMEGKLTEQFYAHQDIHSTIFYLNIVTNRWIGMWLDWISVIFITSVIMILTFVSSVDGSEAGLAVSSAMILTGVFQWGIRQSAAVETQMISIERILNYIEMESEAELESDSANKPAVDWPNKGAISFQDVCLEYGSNSKVLKDISLEVRPEEKVGIIGRTGAGKSSLIASLFRLTEPTGKLEIDGVDISKIGLHDLRSKISIIPQDPVLFQGTLRKNLDPFGKYTDDELWKSVRNVNFLELAKTCTPGLEMEIREGGSNLSVGQRQLICLARAILQNNKILVLDEATANVDLETDGVVQKKVRKIFKHCTVITVAHRLSTVIDCDRIIVMDQGQIKEFDTPFRLLQNPSSALSKMVEQTGEKSSLFLREMCKRKEETVTENEH